MERKAFVVVATYNEAENIVRLIRDLWRHVADVEIVIVDDDSPDGTAQAIESMEKSGPVHLRVRKKERGYAPSMQEGFHWALELGAQQIATMDADFSHDPAALPALISATEHHDLAVGSRYVGGVRVLNWQLRRLFLSVFANRYVRFLTGIPITDCTSGFRCYRRKVLESLMGDRSFRSNGYSFLVEILFSAFRRKYSIVEVPIIYSERREGQSKMSRKMIIEAALLPVLLFLRRS